MPLAFIVKVISGFGFIYIYSEFYGNGSLTADAGAFMHESDLLFDVFKESPSDYFKFLFGLENREMIHHYLSDTHHWDAGPGTLINDSQNVIRIHSIIHFFSFGNVVIHLMVVAFFALLASKFLFRSLRDYIHLPGNTLFWIFVLTPSILFWTSGILKEPFMFMGIALFVYALLGKRSITKKIIAGVLGTILLIGFKPYILVAISISLLGYFIYGFIKKLLITILVGISVFIIIWLFIPQISQPITDHLTKKQFDFQNVARGGFHYRADTCIYIVYVNDNINVNQISIDSNYLMKQIEGEYYKPMSTTPSKTVTIQPNDTPWIYYYSGRQCGSYIKTTSIDNSNKQLLKNIPEALFNATLRPLPGDPGSQLMYISMIEEFLILGLFIFALVSFKRLDIGNKKIVFGFILFGLAILLLIGWTTPVLGAIVRYRFPAQLALIISSLIILTNKKIKT